MLIGRDIRVKRNCPLPTIHCPLPTTHYPLLTAHYSLPNRLQDQHPAPVPVVIVAGRSEISRSRVGQS